MDIKLDYYPTARAASLHIGDHPGLKYLKKTASRSDKVLDVGCGEGSRLAHILSFGRTGWGIDLNPKAVKQAKKQYPRLHFRIADAASLPFPNAAFDLVYSAFAIEHSREPQKFILEMIRVCRRHGCVNILCPNYGAPNRRSPVSTAFPVLKLFRGLIRDFFPTHNLNWQMVTPRHVYDRIDADTTCEPYLGSLVRFVQNQPLTLDQASSLWGLEVKTNNPRKILFKSLGQLGIYPFKFWGPQIFLSVLK